MILIVDNYDSFVYNIARYFEELGQQVVVKRNDAVDEADLKAKAIVISPGPCTPHEAGESLAIVRKFSGRLPILGVCLGHQCIAIAYGGRVVRAGMPVHGRTSGISHDGTSVFVELPSPMRATRYHSLVIDRATLPAALRVIASADDDGEIMAVAHVEHPVVGVQFHPESAASEWGYSLLDVFLHGPTGRRFIAGADALAS